MATFRVPYPGDPERRRLVFERAAAEMARHGSYQGTPDSGSFQGNTPIGRVAGNYHSAAGSEILEIELTQKPWLVPISIVENEVRKLLARA